jgi:mevalonate kinase
MSNSFYSHGKLLLTGEYVVLDGAKALGLPTKFGQTLQVVSTTKKQQIQWKSFLHDHKIWLDLEFVWDEQLQFECKNTSTEAQKLIEIFNWIAKEKPSIFNTETGYDFTSTLEFPKDWGLGSSSTLINNLAQWAEVDAFQLQDFAFGGSGYDVACAQYSTPILFLKETLQPKIIPVEFHPSFTDELFFVYLNQKQNSRDAITHYRSQPIDNIQIAIERTNAITTQLISVTNIKDFELLLKSHEKIVASLLGEFPIQKRLFSDYPRTIKSLGAWGGDFVLATGGEKEKQYFIQKGFTTVLSYAEMIL